MLCELVEALAGHLALRNQWQDTGLRASQAEEVGPLMAVQMVCEGCGKRLRAAEDLAGKKGRCPECQRVMTVEEIQVLEVDRGLAPVNLLPWLLLFALAILLYLNLR